ncbi:MAG: ABC transporter ATP-binding protein [Ruminococcaceae bacterium]|nr:ABC transporter ATP-binding protein [Oscillospiraceae bacterium]
MIFMEHLQKAYRVKGKPRPVLDDITLDVHDGEFMILLGKSGSGKTTLLSVMGLLEPYDGGVYRLDGADTAGLTAAARTDLRREKIGFVFQSYQLIPTLTAFENVEVPLGFDGVPKEERRARVEEALTAVGLEERVHQRVTELSGGEQQRVAIARAIIRQPKVILADEPTGNLDRVNAGEIMKLLQSLRKTVVMVTHDEELTAYADKVFYLRSGALRGSPS